MSNCSKDNLSTPDTSRLQKETRIVIRRHAFEQMYSRKMYGEEVEDVIHTGEIIESYPDDCLEMF